MPPITSQSPETAAPVAPQASLALVATFVAGLLDAVGFVQLSGLFVSFMSGNSTHLGMSLAHADWAAVLAALGVVGAFSAGALGGTLAYDAASPDRRLRLVLLGELVLVLLAMGLVVLGQATAGLALVAFAMGWQNLVHRSVAGADIGRSFITGALFGLGQAAARAIRGTGPVGAVWAYGAAWLAFVIGAAAGALILMRLGLIEALAVAAMLVAGLLLLVLRFRV